MLITLYCNPFFAPCKEKISKIQRFFESIFPEAQNSTPKAGKKQPKTGKQGLQEFTKAALPKKYAYGKGEGVGHAQVCAAKAKPQKDPDLKKGS